MCGILGQINRKGPVNRELFSRMLATMGKRGPDQEGVYFSANAAFGHKRLSILDLTESGRQPMTDEAARLAMVFNGEIYNYQEVRSSLRGSYSWKSRTDTEVLLNAYKELGPGLADKLEGMFAFAIYDDKRQLLTFARDHFGKKPLYYYLDDDTFCFASELKAIIANPEIKAKLRVDELSLSKYLFYGYIPSPNSIFDRIKKLEPATTFQFDVKKWKVIGVRKFWNLEAVQIDKNISEGEILEKTEALIKGSVKKRLMSDVPLGIFLSGGCDSSLIGAYLGKLAPGSDAFTVAYANSPDADETAYARRVAQQHGMRYHACNFEDSVVRDNFIGILDYLDEPMADAAIIPLYFLAKYAKEKIVVALSGDGGDEVFGGYPKYRAQHFIEKFSYLGGLAKVAAPLAGPGHKYAKLFKVFGMDFPERQFIFGSGGFIPGDAARLLNRDSIDTGKVFEEASSYAGLFTQKDVINKSLYLDCKIQLPDWYLVKGDRATMAASLEMRNPLLDKELAEFAFSLGGSWKIRGGEQKYILKKIAAGLVDRDIIYRPKKGFGVPLDKWIRNELKDLFADYLFRENQYFDCAFVRELYDEHMTGKVDRSFYLLRIFNFNYWFAKYGHN
ncbi:MAG TPA: asparagine synthase (glutamine-hydrolyzing) [Elusimicrobia bacterium]|nr:asparagine synthase (glutamine-hydrolyzing) [Elusimicrobiota bacterium]